MGLGPLHAGNREEAREKDRRMLTKAERFDWEGDNDFRVIPGPPVLAGLIGDDGDFDDLIRGELEDTNRFEGESPMPMYEAVVRRTLLRRIDQRARVEIDAESEEEEARKVVERMIEENSEEREWQSGDL